MSDIKYLPFLTGTYTTAPGLLSIEKAHAEWDKRVFQIDDTYHQYLLNKQKCREEGIQKYYYEERLFPETITKVNQYIAHQLIKEYPTQFTLRDGEGKMEFINLLVDERVEIEPDWWTVKNTKYTSLLDALCSQVQEDLAVVQLKDEEDWLSAIHLCSPNHWAPGDKIGRHFQAIHSPVPGMQKALQHYYKMLHTIVKSEVPFTRFAWGIATDTRLNHHPEPPPGVDTEEWKGRTHKKAQTWYIRTERQNLIGFQEVNAFVFTIRTYFYPVDDLNVNEKAMLVLALKSMSAETLQYKGLTDSVDLLIQKLKAED